jgi:hypothetical protein
MVAIACRAGLLALATGLWLAAAQGRALAVGEAAGKPDTQERREYADRLKVARQAYFKVILTSDRNSDRQAHQALDELERQFPGDPVAKAYRGSLELLDAAHNWEIWNLHKQAAEGLSLLDEAVAAAPDEPEARFLRAATSWHLPGFYHRQAQCEEDFALLAKRVEQDAHAGRLPPELAAAALNYWGQIRLRHDDRDGARAAFAAAVRAAPQSPAGVDASKRLR